MKKWFAQHQSDIQKDYFDFLKFKSISADPAFAPEMKACASWLIRWIEQHTTMKPEFVQTKGYPLVYAEDMRAGSGKPTLLVYGHYDVQPVDPLELWESDPFTPTIRNGKVYARGAVDDKGQIFYALLAARAWKEMKGNLPINLKFCIEGEEESASMGLSKSLASLKEKLRADFLLVVDFDQFDAETAAISLGARGIVSMDVMLTGSNSDLHSGVHGGMAYNPNRALVELLAKLWNEEGRVQIPGFYDDVKEESDRYGFHFNEKEYKAQFGIGAIGGEKGRTLAEKNTLRPTLEINGIGGGYTGAGFKTVIPAQAIAKISCRLVPNQDPARIVKQVTQFLEKHVEPGMKVKVTSHGGEAAFRSSADSDLAKAISKAAEEVTGKPCQKQLCGGSIPIIAQMQQMLKAEVVGMGYGLPTDAIHAPNEHFDMKRFEKGFPTVARAFELL